MPYKFHAKECQRGEQIRDEIGRKERKKKDAKGRRPERVKIKFNRHLNLTFAQLGYPECKPYLFKER